jgi:plasmid stabilization system protein ParE
VKYSFLPEAETEYMEAVRFYEDQQAGLGASLISEFEQIIDLALSKPEAWRQVHSSGIRRIGLQRFPYAIFYRVLPDGLQITAFAHHRRRPGYWLKRITSQ